MRAGCGDEAGMRECGVSGDVTQRFFPDGRCFLAKRFAGWSVAEGAAGRGRQAGRGQSPQAGFRQRPGAQAARGGTGQGAWQGSAGCN